MESSQAILLLGVMIIGGHLLGVLFRKTLIPDVLWIMLIGLALGPIGAGYLDPSDFGKLGPILSSIALVVLLYDGGSHLNFKDIASALGSVLGVTLVTLVCSLGVVFSLVYAVTLDIPSSIVAAATLSATSAVVVVPFVKGLPIEQKTKNLLLAEAVIADILCIVITFTVFETFTSGHFDPQHALKFLSSALVGAVVLGVSGAVLWAILMVKYSSLITDLSLTLGTLFVIFGICELFHWSGPLAALCFGFVLNNRSKIPFLYEKLKVSYQDEFDQQMFQRTSNAILEEAIFMLKLFFFLFLGMQLKINDPQVIALSFCIVLGVYFLRLIVTRTVLSRKFFQFDAGVISLMVPKGLVSAVLATQAVQYLPKEHGVWVEELVFAVIFWTILLSSVVVPLLQTDMGQSVISRLFSTFAVPEPVADQSGFSKEGDS